MELEAQQQQLPAIDLIAPQLSPAKRGLALRMWTAIETKSGMENPLGSSPIPILQLWGTWSPLLCPCRFPPCVCWQTLLISPGALPISLDMSPIRPGLNCRTVFELPTRHRPSSLCAFYLWKIPSRAILILFYLFLF